LRCHYALWLCVVFRLMLPVAPASEWSIFNLNSRIVLQSDKAPAARTSTGLAVANATGFSPVRSGPARPDSEPRVKVAGLSILDVLPVLWMLGAAGYLLLVVVHHSKLTKYLKKQQPINDAKLLRLIEEAKAVSGLDQKVEVFESN